MRNRLRGIPGMPAPLPAPFSGPPVQRPKRPTLRDVTADGFVRFDAYMEGATGWAGHVAAGELFMPGRETWLLFLNRFDAPTQWLMNTGDPTPGMIEEEPEVTDAIGVMPLRLDLEQRRVAVSHHAGMVFGLCGVERSELLGVLHLLAGAVVRGRRLPWTPPGATHREEDAWVEDAARAVELVRRGLGPDETLQGLIDAPGGLCNGGGARG